MDAYDPALRASRGSTPAVVTRLTLIEPGGHMRSVHGWQEIFHRALEDLLSALCRARSSTRSGAAANHLDAQPESQHPREECRPLIDAAEVLNEALDNRNFSRGRDLYLSGGTDLPLLSMMSLSHRATIWSVHFCSLSPHIMHFLS